MFQKKNTFTYFRITRLFYGGSMGFFKGSLPNFNLEEIHPDMIFSKYQCYQQPSNRLSFEMQLGFWISELSYSNMTLPWETFAIC